jgi:hypothetical protein
MVSYQKMYNYYLPINKNISSAIFTNTKCTKAVTNEALGFFNIKTFMPIIHRVICVFSVVEQTFTQARCIKSHNILGTDNSLNYTKRTKHDKLLESKNCNLLNFIIYIIFQKKN